MGMFSRKRRSNLLKKFIAPAVMSSSLFFSTNAMKYPWEIKNNGVRFIFDDTYNVLWIDGAYGNKNLVDTIDGKIAESVNNKIKEFKKNDKGIEIRFVKNGINRIDRFRFNKIKNLIKIKFNDDINGFDYDTFCDLNELREINFYKKTKNNIFDFHGCENLKHIVLPEIIYGYDVYFNFKGCKKLQTIQFPKIIKHINNMWFNTFENCHNLYKIENFPKFPKRKDGTNYCLVKTFKNCKNLNFIKIKSGEKLKLFRTFDGCESIYYVYAENVENADNIIDDCTNLITLKLKTSNTRIKSIKYKNTPNLIEINIQQI